MEARIKLVVDSYGLVFLIEDAGLTEESVLTMLIQEGLVSIDEYFDDIEENEE